MTINEIRDGIVIDHIRAGRSMELYNYLGLGKLECSVAIIKNVKSVKMGKKDIIKIDELIDLDIDVLGYIDPGITVNFIKGGKILRKCHPTLPEFVYDVIRCKNPRCITSTEQELQQVFKLTDREHGIYRCVYCDTKRQEEQT